MNYKMLDGTYKKIGERDIMNELYDVAEKEGFDLEKTRFVYEENDDNEVYSIVVEK